MPLVVALMLVGGVGTAYAAVGRGSIGPVDSAAAESPQTAAADTQHGQTSGAPASTDLSLGDVAETLSKLGGANFAGLSIDDDTDTIVTHWVHEVPDRVMDYLEDVPPGIQVDLVVDADYSREQLRAAAQRITQSSLGKNTGVSAVAVNADGSGVTVEFNGDIPAPDQQAALADIAGLPESAMTLVPDSPLHPL